MESARLQARLGRVEVEDFRLQAAVVAFDAAEESLGDYCDERDQQWVDVWLEVQVDGRANMHNWANERGEAAAVLASVRPLVEARGAHRQAAFYVQLASLLCHQARYRIDEEALEVARACVRVTQRDLLGSEPAYPFATLGELLFWHGDTDESEEMFTTALAIVDRAYDPNCRSWCLFGLCRIGVRRHDVEAVRHWSLQAAATVGDCKSQNFVASVKGAAAWVAWKDDRVDDVVRLANEALELWGAMSGVVFYFKGICLWPLMAVRLAGGDIAAAVEASGQILEPAPSAHAG